MRRTVIRLALQFRHTPLAFMVAAYGVAFITILAVGAGSTALRELINNASTVPLNMVVVVLSVLTVRNRVLGAQVRRALAYNGLTFSTLFIANMLWLRDTMGRHGDPGHSAANVFYLLAYPLSIASFLSLPTRRRQDDDPTTFFLDASTVVVAGTMLVGWIIYGLHPMLSHAPLLPDAMHIVYPVGGMLQLFAIGAVLVRRPTDTNRTAFRLLAAGFVVSDVADLSYGLVFPALGFHGSPGVDALYVVTYVLLVASMETYLRRPTPPATDVAARLPGEGTASGFPYAAVLIGNGIVVFVAATTGSRTITLLTTGAAILAMIVLARQYLAARLNVRLLRDRTVRDSEARFRALVQHSSDAIIVVDRTHIIRFVSPSVLRLFGYLPTELIGCPIAQFIHPEDAAGATVILEMASGETSMVPPFEMRVRHVRGSWVQVEAIGSNLLEEPTIRGIVLNTRDVSERKVLERELTHQAFHDPLTNLANRALFRDRVGHALTVAQRSGTPIAVLFLDLDEFKMVNDSLGHAVGDRLLAAAAVRLVACVRTSDTVARLGGDEFALLIEDATSVSECERVAERIAASMRQPFDLAGTEGIITTSIGIAVAAPHETADDLVRNADVAMYMAKSRGKGGYQIFEPRMHARILDRLELESDLRRVIDRGELVVHYQPIVSLASGEILGVEALVRWNHPRRGLLLPGTFIQLAEDTGMINGIGRWVLREACEQGMRWRARNAAHWPRILAVNISGRQLQERQIPGDDFVADVRRVLSESGIDPSMLVLEITESVLMQEGAATLANLQALKALGVSLAIDDFGTGYSSLSYLERFPVDTLKIAKPFVDAVAKGSEEAALARAILAMGRTLRLRTIAEGIESAEQHAELTALGCELGQGNYLGMAMPVDEINARLAHPGGGRMTPSLPMSMAKRPTVTSSRR
ncbi:MAG: hypothetical protein NVS1B4_20160 [Gemmatimonadaceae bacterium]